MKKFKVGDRAVVRYWLEFSCEVVALSYFENQLQYEVWIPALHITVKVSAGRLTTVSQHFRKWWLRKMKVIR